MSILCATDFSSCSRTAIEFARASARRMSDTVTLVHAIEPFPMLVPGAPMQPATIWTPEATEAAALQLEAIAGPLRDEGLTVETKVLIGSPADLIVETARQEGARLIVVGTHGRRGTARLFLGSVAAAVARRASCPVLVTREGASTQHWSASDRLRIVLALDGTRTDATAISWMTSFAEAVPCEVTAVRLYWPPHEAHRYGIEQPWTDVHGTPELKRLIERDLTAELSAFPAAVLAPPRLCSAGGDAAEQLVAQAESMQADALVIALPPRRWRSWMSVAPLDLLRASAVPVLCVPEAADTRPSALPRVRSILVATDLGEVANAAVAYGYGLLAGTGGRVELCHVHSRGNAGGPPGAGELDAVARDRVVERLRALVPTLPAGADVLTNVSALEATDVVEGILQAAERLDVDLVTLASHGRSGVQRALLGSVAEQVTRRSQRPVLVVRPA